MSGREIRAALDRHWTASNANDFETEHDIYREDAVLEYTKRSIPSNSRRRMGARRALASYEWFPKLLGH